MRTPRTEHRHSRRSLFRQVTNDVERYFRSQEFRKLITSLAADPMMLDAYIHFLNEDELFDNPGNWGGIVQKAASRHTAETKPLRNIRDVHDLLVDAAGASECNWSGTKAFQKGKEAISIGVIWLLAKQQGLNLGSASHAIFSVENVGRSRRSVLLDIPKDSPEQAIFRAGQHEIDLVELQGREGKAYECKTYSPGAMKNDGYRKLAVLKHIHIYNRWQTRPLLGALLGQKHVTRLVEQILWRYNPLDLSTHEFELLGCHTEGKIGYPTPRSAR